MRAGGGRVDGWRVGGGGVGLWCWRLGVGCGLLWWALVVLLCCCCVCWGCVWLCGLGVGYRVLSCSAMCGLASAMPLKRPGAS
ncbi:hypothetical protein RA272_28180, partial [Pseudomonas syringae pv. tagetis]|uniref:hypothetical protein n=1 Tax=Pseudomonas syringae group genomosp. 7 TaxID=251699 RepID=UPI00376F83AF